MTREENETLTRTGPGTPMGEVLRRYWMPAALSWELPEPDCPPIRVKLLGEKLVAFRDTQGRVGLLDEFCAHRRASLFLGRNEEGGLRCVYHGWKYDIAGNCLDQPNEPPESNFKQKIHLKAYPTVELGGVVWAYMGPEGKMPALPKFEWTQVPDGYRHVSKTWQECNWLQATEGGIDGVHASFLHRVVRPDTRKAGLRGNVLKSTTPKEEVDLKDYGFTYWSITFLGEKNYVRAYHYVVPFHNFFPFDPQARGDESLMLGSNMWVPMDDENCMVYSLMYRLRGEPLTEEERLNFDRFQGRGPSELQADFRKVRNRDNNWLIDRQVQKIETFTGIDGINTQDHAIAESMGPIVDRTGEHLGSTDRAVFAARRLLLQAVKTVQAGGDPRGVKPSYYGVRSIYRVLDAGVQWRDALGNEVDVLGTVKDGSLSL